MSGRIEIVSSFMDENRCAHAIEALRAAKVADYRIFAPIPSEKIAEAIGRPKSSVRLWVLLGGIIGILSGIAITVGTSLEWNLDTGGKPVVSIPPFIIICFEMMILLGGISAVLGFLFSARMPALEPVSGYVSQFNEDRFGIVVRCDEADAAGIESILRDAGAEEIVREAA
jgi:galactitol-specific phosphotransferase system IIC component